MDNFSIDVTSQKKESLLLALQLCFANHGKAEYYAVIQNTLVLFWADPGAEAVAQLEQKERAGWQQEKELGLGHHHALMVSKTEDVAFTATPCLYKMDAVAATDIVYNWLMHSADYGEEPDHDGSNGKGWRVFTTDYWGHVYGMWQGICAIAPAWAMYGK